MATPESTGARQRARTATLGGACPPSTAQAATAAVQPFQTNFDDWCSWGTRAEPALIFNPQVSQVDLIASLEGRALIMKEWLAVLQCGQGFDAEEDHATVYSNLHILAQEIKLFVEEVGRRERARGEVQP